jgi:LAO/AO transport system kinase
MEKLSVHPGAFIRPSATSGHLGGVARTTRESILLCEAAGFDMILIETVGVGQSEAEARYLTDLFLLLTVAGTGDELQGIKRGIMELPDAVIINKADNTSATALNLSKAQLQSALHLMPLRPTGLHPEVHLCDSLSGKGILPLSEWLSKALHDLRINDTLGQLRRRQELYWFDKLTEGELLKKLLSLPGVTEQLTAHRKQIEKGVENSFTAAERVVDALQKIWPT